MGLGTVLGDPHRSLHDQRHTDRSDISPLAIARRHWSPLRTSETPAGSVRCYQQRWMSSSSGSTGGVMAIWEAADQASGALALRQPP